MLITRQTRYQSEAARKAALRRSQRESAARRRRTRTLYDEHMEQRPVIAHLSLDGVQGLCRERVMGVRATNPTTLLCQRCEADYWAFPDPEIHPYL